MRIRVSSGSPLDNGVFHSRSAMGDAVSDGIVCGAGRSLKSTFSSGSFMDASGGGFPAPNAIIPVQIKIATKPPIRMKIKACALQK